MEDKKFDYILFRLCNAVYQQNTIEKETIGWLITFPKKCDLRSIIFPAISAKICNGLFLNHIRPEIEKIICKN